jgi:molybdopterin/thiamine biosynthesis adenylyltransferase
MANHQERSLWTKKYSRQMLLPQMNGSFGQAFLSRSSVLVIGAGGIGSTVILYLAGAGVGRLDVLDFDRVEESNLHRQILHTELGAKKSEYKAISASQCVLDLNSSITSKPICQKIDDSNALDLLVGYDVVVDATDNYDSRYAINDACARLKIPLVSGSSGDQLYLSFSK